MITVAHPTVARVSSELQSVLAFIVLTSRSQSNRGQSVLSSI